MCLLDLQEGAYLADIIRGVPFTFKACRNLFPTLLIFGVALLAFHSNKPIVMSNVVEPCSPEEILGLQILRMSDCLEASQYDTIPLTAHHNNPRSP